MSKIIVFFMVIAVAAIQGAPVESPFDDILKAANSGEWDKFHTLLSSRFGTDWQPVHLGTVRNLKPIEGGHVYGESEVTFQSSSNYNGQKTEQSAGHKIINKDGQINEFDFKPKYEQNPFSKLS